MNLWVAIAAAGVLTYGIRLSVLALVHHSLLPDAMRHALRFVLPAVLAAIVLPALLYGRSDELRVGLENERLVAGILAAVIAWLTRNVWLTIAMGMSALWLLQ